MFSGARSPQPLLKVAEALGRHCIAYIWFVSRKYGQGIKIGEGGAPDSGVSQSLPTGNFDSKMCRQNKSSRSSPACIPVLSNVIQETFTVVGFFLDVG